MTTLEKVAKMLADHLGIAEENVTAEKEVVKDLGADSLDLVEMLMSLEDEFGVTIPDDKAADIKTVGDIVNLIENK